MTWEEFNDAVRVHMPAHNRRQGIQTQIDALIKGAVVDLQRTIEFYQEGHVEDYEAADLTDAGFATRGDMVAGPISRAWLTEWDEDEEEEVPCEYRDLELVGPENIASFKCGDTRRDQYLLAIDRTGVFFYVAPKVEDTMRLHIEWSGVKTDWDDEDEVRFDEKCAEAVADYVLARISRTVDKDLALATSYAQSYRNHKAQIFSDLRARGRLAN